MLLGIGFMLLYKCVFEACFTAENDLNRGGGQHDGKKILLPWFASIFVKASSRNRRKLSSNKEVTYDCGGASGALVLKDNNDLPDDKAEGYEDTNNKAGIGYA